MDKSFGIFLLASLFILFSCHHRHEYSCLEVPSYPYENIDENEYHDENNWSAVVGDDGNGFYPISNHIRYVEIPENNKNKPLADSLALYYNAVLAFNTGAYDVGTVSRYITEDNWDFKDYANALDSINISGITDTEFSNVIKQICHEAAKEIYKRNDPNETSYNIVSVFYDKFNSLEDKLIDSKLNDDFEFDSRSVVKNYDGIHKKAVTDTTNYREILLRETLLEEDFVKKTVYAREFANANYKNSKLRNDKELVAIIDPILKSGEYSPLLGELWLIWRTAMQIHNLGSPSNDGPMYNLFYNDMKNKVAMTYINHIVDNPKDQVALVEFARLVHTLNIVRNSQCMFGNNANLDEMNLYEECWKNK